MRLRKEIVVFRPAAEAFRYLAEFENAAEWDPGIAEATRLTDGPVRSEPSSTSSRSSGANGSASATA